MKNFILIILMVILITITPGSSSDLFTADIKFNQDDPLLLWWIHGQNYGSFPIKQEIQIYGEPWQNWMTLATGPFVTIKNTNIVFIGGIKINPKKETLPITHIVTKVNILGSLGNFYLTSINDLSWKRNNELNIFFFKEEILWKMVGIRMEGVYMEKVVDFPYFIGPVYQYKKDKSAIKLFFGASAKNSKEKTIKLSYNYFIP